MPSIVQSSIEWVITNYGPYAIWIALGVFGFGLLVGCGKRMLSHLLTVSLELGDKAMTRIVARPKAVALFAIVSALIFPALGAGYVMAPERIVEKPVEVPVPDTTEIDRLSTLLGKAEGKRSEAEARTRIAEGQLEGVRQQAREAREAKEQADTRITDLEERVRKLTPPADDISEMARLWASIDIAHSSGVFNETPPFYDPEFDYHRYFSYRHIKNWYAGAGQSTNYHRGCGICAEELKTRQAMDVILRRHPDWQPTNFSDEDYVERLR